MLFNSLILLFISYSITSRRDKSILYSRITITILLISAFIAYDNLFLLFLAKGIGIFGGLFHTTATTHFSHIFIFLMTSVILLTSFYPRKLWYKEYSSPSRLLFTKLIYYETLLLKKGLPSFLIERSLITLFIVTGSVFLITTSLLISSLLFLVIGTVVGLSQSRIKRLFASTSITVTLKNYIFGFMEFFCFNISPSPFSFYSPCYYSGFNSDKGKGKRKAESEDKPLQDYPEKKNYSDDEDSEYERQVKLAMQESLKQFKYGESSKQGSTLDKDIGNDIALLNSLQSDVNKAAKSFNKLKIEMDNQKINETQKEELLRASKEQYQLCLSKIHIVKDKLYQRGMDPDLYMEQSSNSSYYSSSDKGEYSEEERRNVKRVKYSENNDQNKSFIVPVTLNYKYIFSSGFNLLFVFISGLTLYMIDFNFIENFIVFNVSLTQIMGLQLLFNLLMLIKKNYSICYKLYISYLNEDYFVMYTNVYYTVILAILYFSVNTDTAIFYC